MKHLMLMLFVVLQTIFSSGALAWSPLDEFRSAIESTPYCVSMAVVSETDQEGENKGEEEEEEPDCD
ncbi:MAG: hypothetical protein KJN95_09955 [Gammaproteobacteria bacterium]|nr:hypothetical protein [Gammaproteobacteria bacterium]MBT8437753.1 hypothetical protein [Gammaproteobacteria bacterium]